MSCCYKNNRVSPNHIKNKTIKSNIMEPISILKKKDIPKVRRKSLYPTSKRVDISTKQQQEENKKILELNIAQQKEFNIKFLKEIIKCGGCDESFALGDRQLNINCGACNKFFHCNIAGRCIGEDCKIDGYDSLGYCKGCVNPLLAINTDTTNNCICINCEKSKSTDKKYLIY